eukprot:CCRYP_013655-RA/>CCRYP_013655-RA protein AED:0.19 eAED:0.19 QI:458/1/1/1/0/0/3/2436/100
MTYRIVAASVDNPADSVDKAGVRKSAVDKCLKFIHIVPTTGVILLHTLHPVKHSCNPLELFVFFAGADDFWILSWEGAKNPAWDMGRLFLLLRLSPQGNN